MLISKELEKSCRHLRLLMFFQLAEMKTEREVNRTALGKAGGSKAELQQREHIRNVIGECAE